MQVSVCVCVCVAIKKTLFFHTKMYQHSTDIDECGSGVADCGEHGVCVNSEGSYSCECERGYGLSEYAVTCVGECVCMYICVGGCIVALNYSYHTTTTSDTDECAANNGGCDHNCYNTPGSYYCTCNGGYYLARDGQSCGGGFGCVCVCVCVCAVSIVVGC